MNPEVLDHVLKCPKLPSLPAVAVRVLELTRDENVSFKDLASTITSDIGLTSKVLKTVNSSFYGLRKPCSSINQAIVMLGLSAVKSLALGFSLVSAISRVNGKGFDIQSYWRRSLVAGISAKCVAAESGIGSDEECFLGGLLQDIGVMALLISLGDDYARVLAAAGNHHQLSRYELQTLDVTHADVGALLATRWRLPDELVIPIKYHERPTAAPQEYVKIAHAVALGNAVADVIGASLTGPALKHLYVKAEQWVALKPAQCDAIITRAVPATRDIARLFEVDVGRLPAPEDLLRQAGKQLDTIALPLDSEPNPSNPDGGPDQPDALTGLPGRGAMNRTLVAAFEQAAAGTRPLALAMLAIDPPDQPGAHDVAERHAAFRAIADRLRPHFASERGLLYRFDAERLCVVFADVTCDAATRTLETARNLVARSPLELSVAGAPACSLTRTVSGGVACLDVSTRDRIPDVQSLVSLAESALLAAQRGGHGSLRVFAPRSQAA
ncbi:MAG: HDOD domain-containing protein [Phycisphaerales bacterium]